MHLIQLDNSEPLGYYIRSKKFSIPWYQRAYDWEKDDLDTFWDDLNKSKRDERQHFLGVIMTMPVESIHEVRVIDGQQRITTTILIGKAVNDVLTAFELTGYAELSAIYNDLSNVISDRTPYSSGGHEPRIIPAELNKETFELIFSDRTFNEKKDIFRRGTKIKRTNKLLFDAYEFFYNKISDELTTDTGTSENPVLKPTKTITNYLKENLQHIEEHFIVMPISVRSQTFAYNFFQTVNDRGVPLKLSDILKAYFFDVAGEETDKRDTILDKWTRFMNEIENVKVDDFLRHYWLSKKNDDVSEKYLLANIQKEFDTFTKVSGFLDDLIEESSYYEMLVNEEYMELGEIEPVNNIFALGKNFVLPPLLSAKIIMTPAHYLQFVNMLTVFYFRYRTIVHKEHKILVSLFSNLAVYIRQHYSRNNASTVLTYIKEQLMEFDVEDSLFKMAFNSWELKTNRVPKYILEQLEKHRRDGASEWDPNMSVEHILPKKWQEHWEDFVQEKGFNPNDCLYKLGNLTLLTKPLNASVRNKFFNEKKPNILNRSNYTINQEIGDYDEWTEETIKDRQNKWSELVLEIWNLNNFSF